MLVSATLLTFPKPNRGILGKGKVGIRRNALREEDRLGDRICESVNKVTRADCKASVHLEKPQQTIASCTSLYNKNVKLTVDVKDNDCLLKT